MPRKRGDSRIDQARIKCLYLPLRKHGFTLSMDRPESGIVMFLATALPWREHGSSVSASHHVLDIVCKVLYMEPLRAVVQSDHLCIYLKFPEDITHCAELYIRNAPRGDAEGMEDWHELQDSLGHDRLGYTLGGPLGTPPGMHRDELMDLMYDERQPPADS